ncbi:hypothetical protein LSG31_08820 [Fodinisporobacter ferrooxydans]|uniref:Cellulose biosynthesis protein BcsF n=1 Tax=Fodinisporobacter ferrooxydans TaxID=2901836 RepID=A0ABY4CP24_9BACL|nr:hypothetical protein LSG31_08820 [Alicyclobacillaceae bacterium MYW30-H2]
MILNSTVLLYLIAIPVIFALGRLSANITFLRVKRRKRRRPGRIELMSRGRDS